MRKADEQSGFEPSLEVEAHLARMAGEYQRLYETILGPEITRCRESQDAEWGGPEHDDTHEHWDWVRFLRKFVDAAERYGYLSVVTSNGNPTADRERYEAYLIHVAALAVAAIQSSRRKRNSVTPALTENAK